MQAASRVVDDPVSSWRQHLKRRRQGQVPAHKLLAGRGHGHVPKGRGQVHRQQVVAAAQDVGQVPQLLEAAPQLATGSVDAAKVQHQPLLSVRPRVDAGPGQVVLAASDQRRVRAEPVALLEILDHEVDVLLADEDGGTVERRGRAGFELEVDPLLKRLENAPRSFFLLPPQQSCAKLAAVEDLNGRCDECTASPREPPCHLGKVTPPRQPSGWRPEGAHSLAGPAAAGARLRAAARSWFWPLGSSMPPAVAAAST